MQVNYLLVERNNGLETISRAESLDLGSLRNFFNQQVLSVAQRFFIEKPEVTIPGKANEILVVDLQAVLGVKNNLDLFNVSFEILNSTLNADFTVVGNKMLYLSTFQGVDTLIVLVISKNTRVCVPPRTVRINVAKEPLELPTLHVVDELDVTKGIFPELTTSCDAPLQPVRPLVQVGSSRVMFFEDLRCPGAYSPLPLSQNPCEEGELLQLKRVVKRLVDGEFDITPFRINDMEFREADKAPQTKQCGLVKLIVSPSERAPAPLSYVVESTDDVQLVILPPENFDNERVRRIVVLAVPDPRLGYVFRHSSAEQKNPSGLLVQLSETYVFLTSMTASFSSLDLFVLHAI